MVPQELIAAYVAIIKEEPDINRAAQHAAAFLEDAKNIAQAVQSAIALAKARAGQPVQ